MKPAPTIAAKLDAATPGWPVVEASLADPPTVTVSGVTTAVTGDDPQREIIAAAAAQARSNGRPIRARVSTPGGQVHRLIVTPTGRVVRLDQHPTGRPGTPTGPRKPGPAPRKAKARPGKPARSTRGRRPGRSRGPGRGWVGVGVPRVWGRFPRPVRWVGLVLGVLTVAALVVIVVHDATPAAEAAAGPVGAPAPPPGRLYTQLGPPGWSQQAQWVLPITDGTVPATDPGTGVTAVITGQDRSTPETAGQRVGPRDRWLSVLEPDGRTRYAAEVDGAPRFGPVITRIDGTAVAVIATTRTIRYWPLTGGPGTDVDLPSGARLSTAVGGSVLLTLPGDRVGYLHGGAVRTVQTLPRTTPGIALDGAALVVQPDTGAWWTLTDDAAPTSVTPAAPPGAGPVDRVLAVTGSHVLIAWHPAAADPKTPTVIIAGYDRATGALIATTTTPAGAVARPATVAGNDTAGFTAAGPVILSVPPAGGPATVTVVAGFTATGVADRVYGTVAGRPAVVRADGTPAGLPDGTLIPTGTGGAFLPVISQGRLYALLPADRP